MGFIPERLLMMNDFSNCFLAVCFSFDSLVVEAGSRGSVGLSSFNSFLRLACFFSVCRGQRFAESTE